MTRMIVIRHGESLGNLERRFYGHTDGGLTELGRKQAELAGEYLKDIKIDAAYCSDLSRAYETGKLALKYHGDIEIVPDKNLREIYAGDWENREFESLKSEYVDDYGVWLNDISNCRTTNGESFSELSKRVNDEMWKIAKENEGKTVLIATHATPIRTMISKWKDLNAKEIAELGWVKNASVNIADYDTENNTVNIVLLNEASFLGDLSTQLPKNV